MVLLHLQDARRRSALLCGVRRATSARVRAARHSVLIQRDSLDCPHLALYHARRCEICGVDRRPQKFLPHHVGGAVHMVYRAKPRLFAFRYGRSHLLSRIQPYVLLRRCQVRTLLLETIPRRRVHGHSHDGPRPGPDATHHGLRRLAPLAEKYDNKRYPPILYYSPLSAPWHTPYYIYGCPRHHASREIRRHFQPCGHRRGHARHRGHSLRGGTCSGQLLGCRLGPHIAHHIVHHRPAP